MESSQQPRRSWRARRLCRFAKWCDELGVPVVILGGPPAASTQPLTDLVSEAIAAGARGITIGRRLWQRPIEEATELFEELVSTLHPNRV